MTLTARNALVEQWLGLVRKLAGGYARTDGGKRLGSYEDCYQWGVLGLISAAEDFDPALGFKFVTLAWQRILFKMMAESDRLKKRAIHTRELKPEPAITNSGFARVDRQDEARGLLDLLEGRERAILRAYYWHGLNYERIGKRYGVSRQRIQQIVRKAMDKLRRVA